MPEPLSDPGPRPFVLRRLVDETGVSGTGVVAEGVEFSDGTVALRAKRLLVIVRGPGASLNDFTEWDPEDVINLLLREAHARGLEPPGYHEETR